MMQTLSIPNTQTHTKLCIGISVAAIFTTSISTKPKNSLKVHLYIFQFSPRFSFIVIANDGVYASLPRLFANLFFGLFCWKVLRFSVIQQFFFLSFLALVWVVQFSRIFSCTQHTLAAVSCRQTKREINSTLMNKRETAGADGSEERNFWIQLFCVGVVVEEELHQSIFSNNFPNYIN